MRGPDELPGEWNTGHDRVQCVSFGPTACMTYLSLEALGGFTPLIPDEKN